MEDIKSLTAIINRIQNKEIREFVRQMVEITPQSSWSKRASHRHHMEDERKEYGGLLHTVRVARLIECLCDATNTDDIQKDIVLAAAILHDSCRRGLDGSAEYTILEHPHLVRKLALDNNLSCSVSNRIFDIIECHMGKWGNPPYVPTLCAEDMLHIADVTLARMDYIL